MLCQEKTKKKYKSNTTCRLPPSTGDIHFCNMTDGKIVILGGVIRSNSERSMDKKIDIASNSVEYEVILILKPIFYSYK